ncbi:MAG: UDP-N-acetylmuramate dehydrogenase [Lachnospiraceae bacterium]|nr:UDP-N-acetylmuramate dehydrogenase [Lachnospiraceae bacterium]
MYSIFEQEIREILEPKQIKKDEKLEKHTTFRIGGPADFFVIPKSADEVKQIIKLCMENHTDYFILGNGSNLLVGDKGYRGVILHIGSGMDSLEFAANEEGRTIVTAGAGISLAKLAKEIGKRGLTGFEFAGGIPGTLGGAITMNAGAYGGEIKDCIVSATVVNQNGDILTLTKEQLQLGYRESIIQKEPYIVVEAKFEFEKGQVEEIQGKMAELNKQRREKQPLEFPSAGSTFKRPEGHFAGKLIMDAGLAGYQVGDIKVSEKHCGFVVNVGKGTAADVRKLMDHVRDIVYEKYQVKLDPEVRMIGEF